jgi:uncharacterized membrane protein YhhN
VTGAAFIVLAAMCVAAVGNWIAVIRGNKPLEYLFKPLATVGLIGLALAVDPFDDTVRAFFVTALVLSLAGDVFLMLPRDLFLPGLGAFLFAHVAYVVGMAEADLEPERLGAGVVVTLAVLGVIGARVAAGAYRHAPVMAVAVVIYMLVIGAMMVAAVGTGRPAAVIGAGLFLVSDAMIGWSRFVRPAMLATEHGQPTRVPLAIMVTYHMGQTGLVLSLASGGLWVLLGVLVVMGLVLLSLLDF